MIGSFIFRRIRLKISFVVPLKNEGPVLARGLNELESFLRKWGIPFELILILDPSSDNSQQEFEKLNSSFLEIKKIMNPKHLGRAKSLQQGLDLATGDWLLPLSLDFTVPLGELFTFLQEIHVADSADLVIGNRSTAKKKREAPLNSNWFWTLEKIILEKWRLYDQSIVDPLCGYWALKRTTYLELSDKIRLRRWHYSIDLIKILLSEKKSIAQIPILSKDSRKSRIPLFGEYVKNLF